MKFIHLSDLHIGKRVNEYSMLEDQKYILTKIINVIDDEKPDGVIIAGDVYDKPAPSGEAVELFDDFIVRLAKRKLQVFIISGNHDSPERLAFANRLLDASGIHFSSVYNGEVKPILLEKGEERVNVYMLPFIKPVHVRHAFPEEAERIKTYTDAVQVAVEHMELSGECRNVLVTHQFVTGASRSDSEDTSVGGADNVDACVFKPFDYVALGHIHGPQNIDSERIRYCGTPLKYSFSEVSHEKSVTVVELEGKDGLKVRTVPLVPMRDMVELRGTYEELMQKSFYENTTWCEDYVRIILTDEEDILNVRERLRVVYRNLMSLDFDNNRTRHRAETGTAEDVERKSKLELFSEFYVKQNGVEMTAEQTEIAVRLIEEAWEEKQ